MWGGGETRDVITFISHQVMSGIQRPPPCGQTLYNMDISHMVVFKAKASISKYTDYLIVKYAVFFLFSYCEWRKSFIPRALDENGVASVVQGGIIPLSRQHVNTYHADSIPIIPTVRITRSLLICMQFVYKWRIVTKDLDYQLFKDHKIFRR